MCVDGEHPAGGEFSISSVLDGGETLKDSGNHFVVILEGVVVVPRWSVASGSVVVVVVWLFSLELLSQAETVLHLVLAILVERARALKDLLVLLVVVTLGARFVNGGNDVVWSATGTLTSFEPFRPIMATVPMVTTTVVVASVIGLLVATASCAMSAR